MTEKTLSPEDEANIQDLFQKVTVKIPGVDSDIRAIGYDGFKLAVEQMMEIADLKGKLEALDVSLQTIRSAKLTEL